MSLTISTLRIATFQHVYPIPTFFIDISLAIGMLDIARNKDLNINKLVNCEIYEN